jgi:hypothetical protein
MTDQAYLELHQKISDQYNDNQSTMQEYLASIENLKVQYLKGRKTQILPTLP